MEITIDQLKKFSYLLIACFIISIIIWEVFYNTDQDRYEKSLKNIMQEDYNGVVIKKYADKDNHNSPKLVFSNNKQTAIFGEFYAVILVGDSIVKKKKDSKITVYRNNKEIILDNKDVLKKWFKK